MESVGKGLILTGILLTALGGIVLALNKLGGIQQWKLPGDIYIKGENSSFYFPITTCILISVLLSALGWLYKYLSK